MYSESRVDGIEIDRSVANRVRLKNTFGSYNLSQKPIVFMETDWNKESDYWSYVYGLQPGSNYLRIETNSVINSDRDLVLFVDDALNAWKKGQSMKLSFGGAGVDVDNTFGVFRFIVLTDSQNVMSLSEPYSIEVANIQSGFFESANGKPLFEIICVSVNPLQFSVEILR